VKSPRALLPTEGVDAARSRGDRFDSLVLQSGRSPGFRCPLGFHGFEL
jgi:hypothetical protein